MVVYPRGGRAEDLARFEFRFLFMKITLGVLFVLKLLHLMVIAITLEKLKTDVDAVEALLIFYPAIISSALMLCALCESYIAARIFFFYKLFYDAMEFLSVLAIFLCVKGVFEDCKNLSIEAIFHDKEIAQKDLIFILARCIVFTALILWLTWTYGSYLKAKADDCERMRGFDNPCNDKVDAVMEPFRRESPSTGKPRHLMEHHTCIKCL